MTHLSPAWREKAEAYRRAEKGTRLRKWKELTDHAHKELREWVRVREDARRAEKDAA